MARCRSGSGSDHPPPSPSTNVFPELERTWTNQPYPMFRWRLSPRSRIRSALVRHLFTFALLFAAVVVTGIVRAEDAPTDEPSFEELVRRGDLAWFSGRNADAVRAYARALEIRNEPRIAGRLGLVALAGDAPAQAAHYLMHAIVDGHTIPSGERQQIKNAFDRARSLVSRIGIKLSHVGAQVTIDGKLERMGSSATDFYVFRLPGRHEFRATLEGFEDAVVAVDTRKGETVNVSLVLLPKPVEAPAESEPAVTCEPCKPKSELAPIRSGQSVKDIEDAEDKRVLGQWVPGIGGTVLYGAVSPYPAVGFVLSSHLKINSVISAGLDLRAAMSPRGIEGYAIRGATFALLPSVCATRRWFTGCLAVHTGIMWHSSLAPQVSIVRGSVGGGVSLGARFARYKSVDFRATLYGELLADEYPLRSGSGYRKVLWTGPFFLSGASIMVVWNRTK